MCTCIQENDDYSKKQRSASISEKSVFGLAWDVHELEELMSLGRKLRVEIATLCDKLNV